MPTDADTLALQTWEPRALADVSATGLDEGEVHVWLFPLLQPQNTVAELAKNLSEAERARSSRYHFERDRDRFIVARGRLRQLAGRYAGIPASTVQFLLNAHGKPSVAPEQGSAALEFNLSHSGDWAMAVFARGVAVGVDIEEARALPDMADVARHTFSAGEADALERLPDTEYVDGFFSCWTRKEAYVKAAGLGFSIDLKTFDVRVTPTRHVDSIRNPDTGASYQVEGLRPHQGYLAAIAREISGSPASVDMRWVTKHFCLAP